MNQVVVVGGGISGLSVAWWLKKGGVDAIILEKEQSCGGTMKTTRKDGWLIEHGPNSALETTPLFGKMLEGLGIAKERMYANPRASRRYILRNGTLHPLPTSPISFLTSDLWSPGAKIRLLKEPFVGRGNPGESVAGFVERRLGREFLDYAINPFVAGVYAGNPEQLSVKDAFPKLHALEEKYGGLFVGMFRGRKERRKRAEKSKDRSRLFSFREGMEVFPRAIAASLGDNVITDCDVTSLVASDSGFNVGYDVRSDSRNAQAPVVVLAAPAASSARCIQRLAPETASKLESVFYPPVAEVFFGFRDKQVRRALDGFGFLVPEKEHRQILGTIWSSSLFDGRAPSGHVAMTSFVGGARSPELTDLGDEDLRSLVLNELRRIVGIDGEPVIASVTRWRKAIPQYELGYEAVLRSIEECENRNPGLFFCGNYRGGIAVGDCIMNSEKTAARVLEYIGRNPARPTRVTVRTDLERQVP